MVQVSVTVKDGAQQERVATRIIVAFRSRRAFQADRFALYALSPQDASVFNSRKTRKAVASVLCYVLIRNIDNDMRVLLLS